MTPTLKRAQEIPRATPDGPGSDAVRRIAVAVVDGLGGVGLP